MAEKSASLYTSEQSSRGEDQEDAQLARLGYKHELVREFTSLSSISFAFSILGCVASIASTLNTPSLSAGPGATIWAWAVASVGCICIGLSVAELCSAYPTAGGIYTTTGFVVPSRWRPSVSFVNAWISVIGQLATPASVNFALAQFILAARVIATDGAYVPSTGATLGLYVALNFGMGMYNSLPTKILNKITQLFIFLNITVGLIVIIAVPAGGKGHLLSGKEVFTTVQDATGWGSNGFAFLLGILSASWTMTDYDAAAHMAEEVKNAAVVIPVAITSAVVVTAIFGFFINISLMFGLGDVANMPGPTGLVYAQILWQNLGTKGALGVFTLTIVIQFFTGITCQITCIRTLYAVSRDGALPDRGLLAKVHPVTKTPIWAAFVTAVIMSLFGLLFLISIVAVDAIFSITAVALDLSYAIPVLFKVYLWLVPSEELAFKPGPFNLGKAGYFINCYALAWTCLETVILCMPQVVPVTKDTMNYAAPIMGFVIISAWIWYMVAAHKWYKGPGASVIREKQPDDMRDSVTSEQNVAA